jgi:hypothetical protein
MKHDTKKNKEKVLEALKETLGIVTPACEKVGISRMTFYKWCREDEDFKMRVNEIDDIQGDFVENKLLEKIKSGSEKSIMFYMKYKGKKRGYTDSLDITSDGKSITEIKLIEVKNGNIKD